MSAEFQANDAVQVAGRDLNSNNQFISHTHHYAPTQPAASLPPLRRCPLPSARFTGRKAELEKMARYFFREELKRRNFAIIGMGGCGKSQLAFQFLHEQVLENNRFDPSMVFFIDATTLATLEESWKAIAESKGIGNTARAALDWLSSSQTPSFVLVDNVDDPQFNLREYLPQSTRVSILLTTRLPEAGHKYGSGEGSRIELQALEEADAEELLMTTAGLPDSERPSVKTLLKELHCYALAVVQAGAGIRTLHLSVDQYIQLFRQHRTALMDGKKDGVTPDGLDDYRWTVQSAYRISVSHLHDKPSARFLLGLLGHLHHSGITEELFRRAFLVLETYKPAVALSKEEDSALSLLRELLATFSAPNGSWDTLAFKRAMGELNSLVSYDKTNGYQIHPLICDALREDHPDSLPAAFLLTHAHLLDMSDVVFSHRILPHADRILLSLDELGLHPDLASSLGRICMDLGQRSRSECLLRLAVERCQREAGADAPSTLRCLVQLSYILYMTGRYSEALQIETEVLEKQALLFGPDHPQTVDAMASLAGTLRFLGRYDEAESMERKVLEKRIILLGPDHPRTVDATASLSATLYSLGRYDEAESMGKQVLEKRTMLLGSDHPETVDAMGNLASTLRFLGRYDEAESMEKQVLEKQMMLLGPDHPETVRAMGNLAATLYSLGRYDESESMGKQVLKKRIILLGLDHPDVGRAMVSLSYSIRALGRKEEAHGMMEKGVALWSKSLGEFHPEIVHQRDNLALWRDELEQSKPPIPAIEEIELPQAHYCTIDPSSSTNSIDNTSTPTPQPTSSLEAHSPPPAAAPRPSSPTPPRISSTSKGFLRHVNSLLKRRRGGKYT